jgi:hypothetical protein
MNSEESNKDQLRNNQTENSSEKKELITISIEIDSNREEIIHMYEGDTPDKIAMQFCVDNKLDTKFAASIEDQIIDGIKKFCVPNAVEVQVVPKEPSLSPGSRKKFKMEPIIVDEEDIADENVDQRIMKSSLIKSANTNYLGSSESTQKANSMTQTQSRKSSQSKSADKNRVLWLYQSGIKARQEKEEHSTLEKRKASIKEMEGVTWRPDISKSCQVYLLHRK